MKKYLNVIFILALCILLTACGVSKSELNKSNKEYEKAINGLCEEYKLNDCKIEIEKFSKIDNIYITSMNLYTDEFLNLTSNQAFLFAKELSNLEYEIDTKNSDVIAYNERIISNGSKYYYDTQKDLYYLMKDFESVYTIKNGQVMYDIFEE